MFSKAKRVIRRVRSARGTRQRAERSLTMNVYRAAEADPSPSRRPATTREELNIVCRKIADLDALWRTNPFQESPAEKRAA